MWITNLPPLSVAQLNVGNPQTNYFIAAWKNLKADESKEKLMLCKEAVDRLQKCLDAVPNNVDETAYVSLFLVTDQNIPLEVIRFSSHKRDGTP